MTATALENIRDFQAGNTFLAGHSSAGHCGARAGPPFGAQLGLKGSDQVDGIIAAADFTLDPAAKTRISLFLTGDPFLEQGNVTVHYQEVVGAVALKQRLLIVQTAGSGTRQPLIVRLHRVEELREQERRVVLKSGRHPGQHGGIGDRGAMSAYPGGNRGTGRHVLRQRHQNAHSDVECIATDTLEQLFGNLCTVPVLGRIVG